MSGLAVLFTVLGAAWAVQLFMAWKQAMRFQKDLSNLRKSIDNGVTAVGLGGKRYRGGRAYVALVAGTDGVVQNGLILTGLTVTAKAKPFADYKGFHINEIISGNRVADRKEKVVAAARMAAEHIDAHLKRADQKDAE